MRNIFYISFLFLLNTAWADQTHLKIGDCFPFTKATPNPKISYVVGRVESFNFNTMSFDGTLYAKKNDNSLAFVRYPFTLPYAKQTTVEKIACPKILPKMHN